MPAPTPGDDPALGCPVEYISLKGTSYDKPAVCKYTGKCAAGHVPSRLTHTFALLHEPGENLPCVIMTMHFHAPVA